MANVGYATLQIVPSMRGVQSALQQGISGPAARVGQQAGTKVGEQMSKGIGDRLSAGVARASQVAFKGLEAAAVGAGAATAAALVKGWQRYTTIEDATAALTISLGDATQAAGLLDEVLGVVSGTPFNLDQFAQAGQQLAGMGVDAEKVPGYLTAIGEASATQGSRAQEMAGRLSTVFGQIQAQGQVSLNDVWRISDTGVNALAILANSFGVTRDEMKDMISSGAVPAGQALDAISDGILNGTDGAAGATTALSGTMDGLRETLTGAAGGVNSALSRFGAGLVGVASPALVALFNATADSLDILGDRVANLGSSGVLDAGVGRFVDIVDEIPGYVERAVDVVDDLGPAAAGAAGAVGALATSGFGRLLGPLGIVVPALGPAGPLVAGLAAMAMTSPEVRDSMAEVAVALGDVAGEVGPVVASLLEAGSPLIVTGLEAAAGILENLAGFIADNTEVVWLAIAAWGTWKAALVVNAAWAAAPAAIAAISTAFDRVALSAYNAAGASSAAIGGIAAGAGFLVAAGVMAAAAKGYADATSAAKEWRAEVEANIDTTSVESYKDATLAAMEEMARAKREVAALDDNASAWEKLGAVWRGTIELATPLENSVLDNASALSEAKKALDENADAGMLLQQTYTDIGAALDGMPLGGVQAWVQALDLDPSRMSVEQLASAIDEARTFALNGVPAAETLAGAYETLGDQTASATDKAQAWSDAIDSIIGVNINAAVAADEFAKAIPELTMELAGLGGSLEGTDVSAINARLALAGMAEEAIRTSEALLETEGPEAATYALGAYRNQLVDAAVQAGYSRGEVEAYLASLGMTPEEITTALRLEGVPEAETIIGQTTRDRTVRIGMHVDAPTGPGLPYLHMNIAGALGSIPGFASGGQVGGPPSDKDSVLAALTPGEYVITKEAAKRVGYPALDALNAGVLPGFNRGGRIFEDQPGWNWRTMGNRRASAEIAAQFPNGLLGDLNQDGRLAPGEWERWRAGRFGSSGGGGGSFSAGGGSFSGRPSTGSFSGRPATGRPGFSGSSGSSGGSFSGGSVRVNNPDDLARAFVRHLAPALRTINEGHAAGASERQIEADIRFALAGVT